MWLKSLTDEQREALLGLAHNVVVSDGILDPNEEDMLDEFKREMALKPDVVSDYLELDGIGEIFDSRRARTVAVLNLLRLSYVDGAFEIEEECLLKEVARAFGISDADFALMDNWVRRLVGLEREARDLMVP
ncbi:MAG: TerB family tellurite resistance protein [Gammaproteobacteria bacterium]|nr:TerB family tellurite resistance protein [Gammaproteobacteria bacterium]MDE0444695.1 TerB family tellurite resistance protein [Gammaproteobacteria bacterium]